MGTFDPRINQYIEFLWEQYIVEYALHKIEYRTKQENSMSYDNFMSGAEG